MRSTSLAGLVLVLFGATASAQAVACAAAAA